MNRRQADTVVGAAVGVILLVGGLLSWQAYQQQQTLDEMGSMMGMSMGSVHGTNPLWYVLGTLLVAGVIGGGYVVLRDDLTTAAGQTEPSLEEGAAAPPTTGSPSHEDDDESEEPSDGTTPDAPPTPRVLDLLPEDERRVLEPVLSSPGITQIELRGRSEFSKSKVSQTVSALEKRGLLYRERQGRTYRIYPSDDLQQNAQH